MAYIAPKVYTFRASTSPDLKAQRVYYELSHDEPISYQSPVLLPDIPFVSGQDFVSIDLEDHLKGYEGPIRVGSVSVDQAGNLSDVGAVASAFLDFQVPLPPTEGKIGEAV